jgi:hypothetical protein
MKQSAAAICLVLMLAIAGAAQETYDVIIRNGKVVDGTGNPWILADVGIRGDRIVRIGDLSTARAQRVIDARNLVVAPGLSTRTLTPAVEFSRHPPPIPRSFKVSRRSRKAMMAAALSRFLRRSNR